MATFPQITSPPQASAEVVVNEALVTLAHQALYGKKQSTTAGLTWGYYGGGDADVRWGGFSISDGTVSLTNTSANYLVVARATAVLTTSTSNTNWNDTANYAHAYKLTTAGGVVTVEEDHRAGPSGVHGSANAGGTLTDGDKGDVTVSGSGATWTVDNDVVTNAKAANMATASIKGRTTAGTGDPEDLTAAQAADILAQNIKPTETIFIACSDETSPLTTGTAKSTFRMPYAFTVTAVRASVSTAPTGTGNLTVDVNEAGTTILSTKLTFDASEKTTTTAATPAVISDASLADDAEMTVDVDAVSGTITGTGLKVYLVGHRT